MKIATSLFYVAMASIVFVACKSENSPGYEYMPGMYRSPSWETYGEEKGKEYGTEHGMTALQPAENTIPQGYLPYAYPNTATGYKEAGENLKNPLEFNEDVLAEGKEIYSKMCIHCHGKAGKGDGSVTSNPKWPGPPPAYDSPQLKDLPGGKIFHSIHYGKGLMGPHASLITQEDRWKLVHYVQYLQDKDRKMGVAPAAEGDAETADAENADGAEGEMNNETEKES